MSALFAAMDRGLRPTAYSFSMRGCESFDLVAARRTANEFGLEFRAIELDDDPSDAAEEMVLGLGLRKKTGVQCAWPVVRALDEIEERHVISGHAGDGYFGLTKRAMMHAKDDPEEMERLRLAAFADPDYAQVATLKRYAASLGKTLWTPWRTARVARLFQRRTWKQLNRPRQKEPVRAAFEDGFVRARARLHSDLHKGDSGIATRFDSLLKDERYNPGGRYKSLVGVFNEIARWDRGADAVLIGEAPSRTSDPAHPLSGRGFADKIARLLGVRVSTYLRAFERLNVLDAWPGKTGAKGTAFPAETAREAAAAMSTALPGRRVVFAGKRTALAFGFVEDYLRWGRCKNFRAAILPHPSGINRWWNDPRNRARAKRFLRELISGGEK